MMAESTRLMAVGLVLSCPGLGPSRVQSYPGCSMDESSYSSNSNSTSEDLSVDLTLPEAS